MTLRLGIGVVTYNRRNVLAETLEHIRRRTKYPSFTVAVADDGSTDGTMEMLRARGITAVTGRNMGVAWNKNRALFLLSELQRCDVVILLEDDTFPTQDGWEREWIYAALRWGHANLAAPWMDHHFVAGTGTLDDPMVGSVITAQCAVYSREALLFGGYFDSRFRGFGHEHVEHSRRLVRMGYGGTDEPLADGTCRTLFKMLRSGMSFVRVASAFNQEQVDRNLGVAREAFGDLSYRAPWRDEEEMQQFRQEMRAATPRLL